MSKPKNERYTIAVDFDGVIHSYSSPWIAPHVIPDVPVGGAINWLHDMIQRFDVVIFSTRARTWRGRRAMRAWLQLYGGMRWFKSSAGDRGLELIRYSYEKPPALVYIDDRAFRFEGAFPTKEEIHQLKPWNKRK